MDLFYLHVTYDEKYQKVIQIIQHDQGEYDELLELPVPVEQDQPIYFKVVILGEWLQFYYRVASSEWKEIGPALPFGNLGDEYGGKLGFTGAFVGVCCQDLSGQNAYADFDYFEYKNL